MPRMSKKKTVSWSTKTEGSVTFYLLIFRMNLVPWAHIIKKEKSKINKFNWRKEKNPSQAMSATPNKTVANNL